MFPPSHSQNVRLLLTPPRNLSSNLVWVVYDYCAWMSFKCRKAFTRCITGKSFYSDLPVNKYYRVPIIYQHTLIDARGANHLSRCINQICDQYSRIVHGQRGQKLFRVLPIIFTHNYHLSHDDEYIQEHMTVSWTLTNTNVRMRKHAG